MYPKRGIALDLRQLQTFQMIAVTGSFTRTAEALGYAQSNVTYQIKTLEEELGTELFTRVRFSRQVTLTDSGRRLLRYSKPMLQLAFGLLSKESSGRGP